MKRALIVVLVLLVAAGGFFYYRNRAATHMTAGAIPDLVMLAPQESSTIIYADVAALRASPFLKRLIALLPPVQQDKDYEEFVRGTGFDYTRDLDQILVALHKQSSKHLIAKYSTFAFAVGRFNRQRILRYASEESLRKNAFLAQDNGDEYSVRSNGRILNFKFLSQDRLALASGEYAQAPSPSGQKKMAPVPLETVFDLAFASQPGPELQERIGRVSGSAFFAVGRMEPEPNASGANKNSGRLPDQINQVLESLRWFTAAARPDGDSLKVALEGECDGALKAQQLSLLLDAFRVLARSALKDPQSRRNLSPEQVVILEHILKNAVISRDGHRVILRFELSSTLLPATPSS